MNFISANLGKDETELGKWPVPNLHHIARSYHCFEKDLQHLLAKFVKFFCISKWQKRHFSRLDLEDNVCGFIDTIASADLQNNSKNLGGCKSDRICLSDNKVWSQSRRLKRTSSLVKNSRPAKIVPTGANVATVGAWTQEEKIFTAKKSPSLATKLKVINSSSHFNKFIS